MNKVAAGLCFILGIVVIALGFGLVFDFTWIVIAKIALIVLVFIAGIMCLVFGISVLQD